jgi:hypothetical protein
MSEKETVGTESAAALVKATLNISTNTHYVTKELASDITLFKG